MILTSDELQGFEDAGLEIINDTGSMCLYDPVINGLITVEQANRMMESSVVLAVRVGTLAMEVADVLFRRTQNIGTDDCPKGSNFKLQVFRVDKLEMAEFIDVYTERSGRSKP